MSSKPKVGKFISLTIKPRPNLFRHATSELSQDAFLCWLLEWADSGCEPLDSKLHRVARCFLESLLKAASPNARLTPGARVLVHRQFKRADVVAEIGDDLVLVIEDKVHTGNHSDQLRRYREALEKHFDGRQLVCVYLKTGDQDSYSAVRSKDWAVFRRADMLDIFRGNKDVSHDVFRDFVAYLEHLEAMTDRYRNVPPSEWGRCDSAYKGLFLALQRTLKTGAWKTVPNPNGGFIGFWWGSHKVDGGHLYLQLEEDSFVVKIAVNDRSRRSQLRELWWPRLDNNLDNFKKPKRLGHGKTMTLATFNGDYRVLGKDGLLDLNETTRRLENYTAKLSELISAQEKLGE